MAERDKKLNKEAVWNYRRYANSWCQSHIGPTWPINPLWRM